MIYIKLKKIKINIICLFLIFLFVTINFSPYMIIMLSCIFIHELGHIIFIKANKLKITEIDILPFGINIATEHKLTSYGADISTALSGPLSNIAYSLINLLIIKISGYNSLLMFSFLSNIIYAGINLFPVRSLDGGRAWSTILKLILPEHTAYILSAVVSAIFLGILSVIAFFILMVTGYNFTLVLLCCYLFYTIHFSPNTK